MSITRNILNLAAVFPAMYVEILPEMKEPGGGALGARAPKSLQ